MLAAGLVRVPLLALAAAAARVQLPAAGRRDLPEPAAAAGGASPAPAPAPAVDEAGLSDDELVALAGNIAYSERVLKDAGDRPRPASPPGNRSMRRVYLDLGANWANTLRLYEDIGARRSESPWEVYAFEASPFIHPYLEAFVKYLNRQGERPLVTVPPTGSTRHLRRLAPRFGCWPLNDDRMRECMWKTFAKELAALRMDKSLMNRSLIADRLAAAGRPATADRFVHVPAAVGVKDGDLEMGLMTPRQMIRGGALDAPVAGAPTAVVPLVDVVSWLAGNFQRDDYVVVKMDIEGMEFPILKELMKRRRRHACLIDVLAFECHPGSGNCAALSETLNKQQPCIQVVEQPEWDHFSAPDVYYPVDPRNPGGGS